MQNLAPNKNIGIANRVLLIMAVLLFSGGATHIALAQTSVTDALYSLALNITNTTASQKDDIQVPFTLSTPA